MKGRVSSLWDAAAVVLATLLALNFLMVGAMAFVALGRLFLEPLAAITTAVSLLLGIGGHLVTRRHTGKLWRRLLLLGIALNLVLVGLYVLVAAAMLLSWR